MSETVYKVGELEAGRRRTIPLAEATGLQLNLAVSRALGRDPRRHSIVSGEGERGWIEFVQADEANRALLGELGVDEKVVKRARPLADYQGDLNAAIEACEAAGKRWTIVRVGMTTYRAQADWDNDGPFEEATTPARAAIEALLLALGVTEVEP